MDRFRPSVDFLNRLMHDQGGVLMLIMREATVKVDAIDDKLLKGWLQHKRFDLGQLRRALVRLQRLRAPEPGALFCLLRQPPPWVTAHDLDELRQATEESTMIIRDVAELKARIKLLQEEIAAQMNPQTNRSLFTLTIGTVLALPINILAGQFGLNMGGIPLAQDPHGFWVIVTIIVAFTALAGWLDSARRTDLPDSERPALTAYWQNGGSTPRGLGVPALAVDPKQTDDFWPAHAADGPNLETEKENESCNKTSFTTRFPLALLLGATLGAMLG